MCLKVVVIVLSSFVLLPILILVVAKSIVRTLLIPERLHFPPELLSDEKLCSEEEHDEHTRFLYLRHLPQQEAHDDSDEYEFSPSDESENDKETSLNILEIGFVENDFIGPNDDEEEMDQSMEVEFTHEDLETFLDDIKCKICLNPKVYQSETISQPQPKLCQCHPKIE